MQHLVFVVECLIFSSLAQHFVFGIRCQILHFQFGLHKSLRLGNLGKNLKVFTVKLPVAVLRSGFVEKLGVGQFINRNRNFAVFLSHIDFALGDFGGERASQILDIGEGF